MKLLTLALTVSLLFAQPEPTGEHEYEPESEPEVVLESEPEAQPQYDIVNMRITFYVLRGTMYSGYQTHLGAAACSWIYPIGTQFRMPDGFIVTCLDRGLGDYYWPNHWLDIWTPSYAWGITNVEAAYGLYENIELIRWGWN